MGRGAARAPDASADVEKLATSQERRSVQEGLCTLLDLAQRGALPEDPGAWDAMLAGVVRNVARNRRRRHDRARPHKPLDAEALESWYEGVMKQVVQSRGKGYMEIVREARRLLGLAITAAPPSTPAR